MVVSHTLPKLFIITASLHLFLFALINSPSIVMADEPTGNLDSANARELHKLFIDLRNQFNQTFLIVTHNEELAKMSDRILMMKDGVMCW